MADLVIAGTSEETCSCCGGTPPSCACALLIPSLGEDPFATLEDAAAAIAGFVSNCIGFIQLSPGDGVDPPPTLTSFDADDSTENELTLDGVMAVDALDTPFLIMFGSIVTAATSTLTVNWTVTADNLSNVQFDILDCSGTTIITSQEDDSGESGSGTWVFSDLPAGEYVIVFYVNWDEGNTSDEASCTVSCDGEMAVNQVIAQIDPGAGVLNNELRACPALDWANCAPDPSFDAAAAAAWMEEFAASCLVAYATCGLVGATIDSLTASFDGTTLSAAADTDFSPDAASVDLAASVNLEAGSTLTVVYSFDSAQDPYLYLQDRHGNYITGDFDGSVTSGTLTVPVAATGEYFIQFGCSGGSASTVSTSWSVTCDMPMTVNPVSVLYNDDTTCNRRLMCA